ncbi:MAG: response regulator [Clostridia bacterium]|nr:response regulator [Clostridia bacterium]
MVQLYIADIDPRFIQRARRAISGCRAVEVVGDAASGRRALSDIQRLRPDVLLTDIQLPELDGIALLRETRRLRDAPAVIVCTRFYSDVSMEWAFRYGASYFLCKPIDYERLADLVIDCAALSPGDARILDDAGVDAQDQRAARVRALLTDMGISPKLNGSVYLVESVLRARENDLLLRNLSRGLYVELASQLDTTVARVERSLRSAISIAYERGSLSRHFPERPTNKQLIEYLLRESDAMPR